MIIVKYKIEFGERNRDTKNDILRWAIDKRPDLIEPYTKYARQVVDIALS